MNGEESICSEWWKLLLNTALRRKDEGMYYPNGFGPLLKIDQKHGPDGWSEEEFVSFCRLSNLCGRRSHGQPISYFHLSNTFFIDYVTKASNSAIIQTQPVRFLHWFFSVGFFFPTSRLFELMGGSKSEQRDFQSSISLQQAFLWEN